MSWIFTNTYTGQSITLPIAPHTASVRQGATLMSIDNPGFKPFIMSYGLSNRELTLEGWIYHEGYDADDLESNYITPLQNLVYQEVQITCPNGRYSGLWILQSFDFTEEAGIIKAFRYTMSLIMGDLHLVW